MSTNSIIVVNTLPCMVCHKVSQVYVNEEDYHDWVKGKLIQQAFPYLDDNQRELLITGTHPECWDEMVPEED